MKILADDQLSRLLEIMTKGSNPCTINDLSLYDLIREQQNYIQRRQQDTSTQSGPKLQVVEAFNTELDPNCPKKLIRKIRFKAELLKWVQASVLNATDGKLYPEPMALLKQEDGSVVIWR